MLSRVWLFVLTLACVSAPSFAAGRIIDRIELQPGQLNWLGSSLPPGHTTFRLSADGRNAEIVDAHGTAYPLIVRSPEETAYAARVQALAAAQPRDTLFERFQAAERSKLQSGATPEETALYLADWLQSTGRVANVRVDGAYVEYQRTDQPWSTCHQVVPTRSLPPPDSAYQAIVAQMITSLRRGEMVFVQWSGRTTRISPQHLSAARTAVANIQRGGRSDFPLNPEVLQLLRRPIDRTTMRPKQED